MVSHMAAVEGLPSQLKAQLGKDSFETSLLVIGIIQFLLGHWTEELSSPLNDQ